MIEIKKKPAKANGPVNNFLGRTGDDRDHLFIAEGKKGFPGECIRLERQPKEKGLALVPSSRARAPFTGRYISQIVKCRFPSTEMLPSWNIRLYGPDQGFRLYMRLFGESAAKPSPWLMVGEGGNPPVASVKTEAAAWGCTRIDYLELKKPACAFQFRVDLFASDRSLIDQKKSPTICRFYVHYSGQGETVKLAPIQKSTSPTRLSSHIKVPYRSQLKVEVEKLRQVICCPTSLAMVLEHYGIDKPTLTVCEEVYDPRYKIYGVWPRASQAAFQAGLNSWIQRIRTHRQVYDLLDAGQPIIASIRVGEGELRGAQYPRSNGHIIVITGYHKDGTYIVNDPASAGKEGSEIDYNADDMEKVWLDKGGVAILVKPETRK